MGEPMFFLGRPLRELLVNNKASLGSKHPADSHGERAFSPADKLDGLSHHQKEEVESQSRPNAALIHETIRAEGESELERTAGALVLSGLAAGLSMGFSLIVQGELHANLPEGPARALLTPLGYTVGFLIVVLGRQQLFTENTLTPILPLLHNRDSATLGNVARLWVLVLTSNIVGTWLVAAAVAQPRCSNRTSCMR